MRILINRHIFELRYKHKITYTP